ncbi:hypothetical protein TRVL_09451 [Trypanosoma vivax]|nr:hypothetical protein TRVL_09451 [Trypanosoma vivax]
MRANITIPFFIQSLRNISKLRTGMTRFVQTVRACKQLISYHDTGNSNGLILSIHSALVAGTLENCKQSLSAMTQTRALTHLYTTPVYDHKAAESILQDDKKCHCTL